MAAQFVDALKGYDVFLASRGRASRMQINDELTRIGRSPISKRTFAHYNKLLQNGFRSYVPINKFDVFQALGKIQMAADRRRYHRSKVSIKAEISRDTRRWLGATIVDRSLVGFGIVTSSRFPIRQGSHVWVRIDEYQDIPMIVVWRRHGDELTKLGARAFEFVAKYRVSEEDLAAHRRTGIVQLRRRDTSALAWRNLFRILERVDELLEATADLLLSVDELVHTDVHLAPSQIAMIRFASPGEAQIKVDFGVADILRVVFEKLQFWRTQKKRAELETANLAIETARNAIRFEREAKEAGIPGLLITAIMDPVCRALGLEELPEEAFEETSLEAGIVANRILPPAAELVAGDDLDFEIEVTGENGDE